MYAINYVSVLVNFGVRVRRVAIAVFENKLVVCYMYYVEEAN